MPTVKRRLGLAIAACTSALLLGCPYAGKAAKVANPSDWSAPATLARCSDPSAPIVLFPSDRPQHGTGQGAILWAVSKTGCGGGVGLRIAAIGAGDAPAQAHSLLGPMDRPLELANVSAAATGPKGRIVVAGLAPNAPNPGANGSFTQGLAQGPFERPTPMGGPPTPATAVTAYLGDMAIASLAASHAKEDLQLRIQRHYASGFGRPVTLSRGEPAPSEIALALDFRSEALVAWTQGGSVLARTRSEHTGLGAIQRLGPADQSSQIVALNSDDDRGTVVWSTQSGRETSIYADISPRGFHFGSPQLLERFRDPEALPWPPGSLRLVRLAREAVMIAWTGAQDGRYVVRVATVGHGHVRRPRTISMPGSNALLRAFAPGPANEVLALWSVIGAPARKVDLSSQAIFAARVADITGTPLPGPPEQVSAPGPSSGASAAFDPDSDNAVAAWSEDGSIRYAVRAAHPAALLSLAAHGHHEGTPAGSWPWAGLGAFLVICLLVGALVLLGRGRGYDTQKGRARARGRARETHSNQTHHPSDSARPRKSG